ncbi:MAG TPA: DUF1592 domain-containing protein [Myxococcaceae bacterium]|nr:DUF1592 domain-containing protein [Myxococcaceae bacterium]
MKPVELAQELAQPVERGRGLKYGLRAVLLSPHFLFRVELPEDGVPEGKLTQHALATRLSYFLWASTPDDELLSLADRGQLDSPEVYGGQVGRLAAAPRFEDALVHRFGGQWLGFNRFDAIAPQPEKFPGIDADLKAAMKKEGELFFRAFLAEDRSALDMLDADFTFVNARLASFYGLTGVSSTEHQKVTVADGKRGGLLTEAGLLASTSLATRTSPVQRGKWILARMLCQEPSSPPLNVEALKPTPTDPDATVRQLAEAHRSDSTCSVCHQVMDPIGFGLENYDASGAYREFENGRPVDASGLLPDGRTFSGARALGGTLKADPKIASCIALHAVDYAFGRHEEQVDAVAEDFGQRFQADQYRLGRLFQTIAGSDTFKAQCGPRK